MPEYREVEDLLREHRERRDRIRRRLAEFAAVDPSHYYYELAYCLLTPQSSAANAGAAVERLQRADGEGTLVDLAELLRRGGPYIRFHNTKARRLAEARAAFPLIAARLGDRGSPEELRDWLVRNVKGLGLKEASHFLRNIGCRDLAILDRHILRNLKRHRVIRSVPASLTPRRYLAVERSFRRFAQAVGVPMDELDLLFWSRETGEILK